MPVNINLNNVQPTLVSGTNIKTVNSNSLLGSGNVAVQDVLVSGTNIKTINGNTILGSGDITVGGGITVGTTTVTSGTDTRVFFQQGGVVQQDANFTFNNTQKRLTLRAGGATASDIPFVVRNSTDTFDILACYGNELTIIGRNASNEPRLLINRAGSTKMVLGGTTDLNIEFPSSGMGQINSGAQGLDIISSSGDIRTRNSSTYTLLKGNFFGIGQATPAARLDVKAQGALSTDIAFRVRNSADTLDSFYVNGLGQGGIKSNSYTPRFAVSYDWAGGHRDAFVFTQNIQNFRGQTWTFDAGYNGNAERLIISNDLTSNEQGYFSICQNNFNFGKTYHPAEISSERRVLRIYNGVAPSARTIAETDFFKMYSADISAGNAAPHFETENGNIIKLFRGAALTASDGTLANAVTRIAELEARLQAHGLIA